MRIGNRLTAATDVATFILFDPGAIQGITLDFSDPDSAIDALTATGRAIFYSYASDGEADFLVLVGEEPDADYVKRQRNRIADVLLHVPTGRLIATGFEDLTRWNKPPGSTDPIEPTMGDATTIPPGDYVVEAFEVDWDDLPEQEISDRAKPGDEAFETTLMTSMGCVIVATIFLLPVILGIIWSASGFMTALEWAGYALAFHVVYWAVVIPTLSYSKRCERMSDLRKSVESQYPGVVLVLRPLVGDATNRQFQAGKFGEGFARFE